MGAIAANTVVSWTDSDGGDHDGSLVTRAKGFDVIACAICGFRHVIPLPDTAELERTYRDTHHTEEKPMSLAHAGEDPQPCQRTAMRARRLHSAQAWRPGGEARVWLRHGSPASRGPRRR